MNYRNNLFTPRFEIDDNGSVLCKTHSEYITLKNYALNTYYYQFRNRLFTCKSCDHYFNNNCYFPKAMLDRIISDKGVLHRKFKCSMCNSRIRLLFNILHQKWYEKKYNVHISQICCFCYQTLSAKNPKKHSFKVAIGVCIPIIMFLSFLYFNFIFCFPQLFRHPFTLFYLISTTILLSLPAVILFMKAIKRWNYIKKNHPDVLHDYPIKDDRREDFASIQPYKGSNGHGKKIANEKHLNPSVVQISKWALNKLNKNVDLSNDKLLEMERIIVKPASIFDDKKFIVRLDPEIAKLSKLGSGDAIQLINPQTKTHVFRLLGKFKIIDKGTRFILLNKSTRNLLKTEIDDEILINKVDFGFAEKLVIAGLEKYPPVEIKQNSLKNIVLGIGDEFQFGNFAVRFPYKVVDYLPQHEVVILNSKTKIEILNLKFSDVINNKQ